MICAGCQEWITPEVDAVAQQVRCPRCGHSEARPILPLFIVTGPSGTGKTAVVVPLQGLLPGWEIFETDILGDSGGDWNMIKCNWLRIAAALAQRGRPTILCGTMQPAELADCSARVFFSTIHWLALQCAEATLAARLQARPAWRGCDAAFIQGQLAYSRWFDANASSAFDPPLAVIDTTAAPLAQTAAQIRAWALARWPERQQPASE